MFTKAKCRVVSSLATITLLGATLFVTPTAQAQSQQSSVGLVGAWSVSVTLTDCNGTIKGTFPSMLLFSRGGNVTETTFNPLFLPGQRGTGLGVWSLNDDGTYSATDVAFILYSSLMFTKGTQEISHTITLNSDATGWSDDAIVQFYDLDHNKLAHACATASAVRLQ